MAFTLDENGLQYLIHKIQNQTIQTHTYSNVVAQSGDILSSSIIFLKIRKNVNTPWVIKYKVTSNIPTLNNSTQMADVIVGGVGDTLSYYYTSNIIYDIKRQSAKNHIVILKGENYPNFIGIDISNHYNEKHNIIIDIQYVYGCSVSFLNEAKPLNDKDNITSVQLFDFFTPGIHLDGDSDNLVKREELSDLAFSGNYEDILNKPKLLDISIENDELFFFKI